ncbi:6798_t:CDS:2 [Acaulospora colombiana]|uniref:6798_t:CDS:1 n=1 Tax=Acaulospora colombiana TaxID=27376 RepID=A0ACA9MB23_9GLOM|nr:6798_t:CDS:2 [Acaulospora colombiana]
MIPNSAKHFRAKDRQRNVQEYPKLHYPEVYILEGGYCSKHATPVDMYKWMHPNTVTLEQLRLDSSGNGTEPKVIPMVNQTCRIKLGMGSLYRHLRLSNTDARWHLLATLEEDHQGHDDQETQEDLPDEQSEGEETAGENDYDDDDQQTVDSDLHDRVHDISFDDESQGFGSANSPFTQDPAVSQGEEMKRAKNRGRQLLEKTFRPFSLFPSGRLGLNKAGSHAS